MKAAPDWAPERPFLCRLVDAAIQLFNRGDLLDCEPSEASSKHEAGLAADANPHQSRVAGGLVARDLGDPMASLRFTGCDLPCQAPGKPLRNQALATTAAPTYPAYR